ncbi:MAG: DoxX family protein [Actinobacteria bacterium]|nr:MAG: DoxX family protein [Actinomycetota bacterium]
MDYASIGLLLIRLVIGLTFAGHGAQKLFGWFGGHGLAGTGVFFDSLGVKPGKPMALLAGLGEVGGGLLLAAGLFTPLAAVVITVTMFVAIFTVTGKNGYWITANGYEYSVAIIAVAVGVALTGPGAYALDKILFV